MMATRNSVWKYYLGVVFVICEAAISDCEILEPIYWNSSNSKFLPNKGLVMYPQIGDKMDIICPKVDSRITGQYEYYKLYMVSKEDADNCNAVPSPSPLLNCNKPDQDVIYTIKFQEFSPNLWGLEFQKNKDYFIISTSNGSKEGLDNREGGVCQTKAMKLIVKVGQDPSYVGPKETTTRAPGKDRDGTTNKPTQKNVNEGGTKSMTVINKPSLPPNDSGGGKIFSNDVALFTGIGSGCVIFIIIIIMLVVLLLKYKRRHRKHSPQHTATLSLSTLATPKRGGNNNGSEPSDIIIPLRTADSAFCPHYEKVSGDYGHPVYIVQEMPPQSPANIYYKV
ncbi:ephrin-B2 [Callorhinchus milii]|uniref:Ephrin-B2a n=1 Tax=Callorhinchus milii TaxID=7868 RepID=A0A4W3H3T5_CALMI|nr:ephrin-B2 [Callorhinchus milii]|eukprot:gi/632952090/ref/XP_007891660.1/ PREDICTED: ephrin-B2 [Callorhinchus milii]